MTLKKLWVFCCFLVCQCICAQQDSIALNEVVISDSQLRKFSNTHGIQTLNDSVIRSNRNSLTSLLNNNSGIVFKENGLGMVSSPSFRGTSAQQTAVIWNGININSQFNGQTDFNTISPTDYSSIAIRPGGGSVIYGSSAIGGSIHLNNDLSLRKRFKNKVDVSYGNFNTLSTHYNVMASSDKFSIDAGFSRNSSDNDYDYPDSDLQNRNGQYQNLSLNANAAYRFNAANTFKIYSQVFDGERNFSLLLPTDTRTKYRDFNTRNLFEWSNVSGNFISKLRTAFLTEEYTYFRNLETDLQSSSSAETFIAKYDASYQLTPSLLINAIADYSKTTGNGNDIGQNRREITALVLLIRHQVTAKFLYEIGARKEITANYQSPLLFSVGGKYKISDYYALRLNASHNFRIPTFNDLYWFEGGNPNLKPESSYQAELGNEFQYKNFTAIVSAYYNKISDMIQWLPGTTSMWFPQNITNVSSYGIESNLQWTKSVAKHTFNFTGSYAYTVSQDDDSGFQLIYVPFHKATAALAYSHERFEADYQFLFNGEVFTRSDNAARYNLDAYTVSNIGIAYRIGKKDNLKVGARMMNVFDANYQVMARRPFPGRNYTVYLNLNI